MQQSRAMFKTGDVIISQWNVIFLVVDVTAKSYLVVQLYNPSPVRNYYHEPYLIYKHPEGSGYYSHV